mmetsp:Transcript_16457/g.29225  ORF Transcript_16457/g.29225 Transcript_16457/m.29225 type:complete len:349 (-) Transcript_16457:78-1124(-)
MSAFEQEMARFRLLGSSLTCDLGELGRDQCSDGNMSDEGAHHGLETVNSRSDSPGSTSRSQSGKSVPHPSESGKGGAAADVRQKFEAQLIEAIQSLEDKNASRVFSLLLTYINMLKPAIVSDVTRECQSRSSDQTKSIEVRLDDLAARQKQLGEQLKQPANRLLGRASPGGMTSALSSAAQRWSQQLAADRSPRIVSRAPHPPSAPTRDSTYRRATVHTKADASGSAAAPRLPSWLRVEPKSTSSASSRPKPRATTSEEPQMPVVAEVGGSPPVSDEISPGSSLSLSSYRKANSSSSIPEDRQSTTEGSGEPRILGPRAEVDPTASLRPSTQRLQVGPSQPSQGFSSP